jgi:hypothetical protein
MDEHLEPSVIYGLSEARVLEQSKGTRGQKAGHYRLKSTFFRSLIGMNDIDNKTFNEIADYHEMTLEGSTKGIYPFCCQSVEVIGSCVDTLDIHYLMQGGGAKLCPGSGKQFYEYLNAPSRT